MSIEIQGYGGLDTLIRAAFLRPVHIVRQFISNHGIGYSPIAPYHQNNGLSIALKNQGFRRITNIPDITNPIGRYT